MFKVIQRIHKTLIKEHKTVAVAESCTGGIISSFLTQNSGSSAYFKLGVVAYSNQAKQSLLKIPASLINKYGAVSRPVAQAMAKNIRKIAKTDFGIGISGIAGPTGETPAKPVGTVFIALATKNTTICDMRRFRGSRTSIRQHAAVAALRLLKTVVKS
jgi:nicotinamide-nucleotide amidase